MRALAMALLLAACGGDDATIADDVRAPVAVDAGATVTAIECATGDAGARCCRALADGCVAGERAVQCDDGARSLSLARGACTWRAGGFGCCR